ncbi:FecR family protein [Litoribacter populi]|uniref:FecR family protein n=1 Tax=Litoribacter populi TaxID=2598460 RepID=UPI00117E57C4|nr:FecR family protein [Litoribacter populi]
MKYDPNIQKLITAALRNKLSKKDWETLNSWYDRQESESTFIEDHLRRTSPQVKKKLWAGIEGQLDRERKRRIWVYTGIAASLLMVISCTMAFHFSSIKKNTPIENTYSVENGVGMKKKIRLPDGSRVTLFHNSSISYGERFGENRNVKLKGKAFFEVVADSIHPFQVISDGLTTRVLGTSFQVESHQKTVAVRSGKVQVRFEAEESSEAYEISANQFFKNQKGKASINTIENPSRYFGWLEGELYFENTSMLDLEQTLNDWYGVKISSNAADMSCKLSGTYRGQSLEDLLTAIQYSIPLTFQINQNHVDILFETCAKE